MIATLFIAALATAQAQAPQASPAPARPRTICRNENDTGSRMGGRRVCRTVGSAQNDADRRAEEEARDTQARIAEETERARDNNGQSAMGSNSPT